MMTLTAETTVDEQATLRSLETFTGKLREAARHRDVMNELFRRLSVCESEERRAAQDVDLVESRLKAFRKQILFATVKSGELALLRHQLTEANEVLSMRRQELEEQREIFCVCQEAQTQLVTEIDAREQ